MASAEPIRDQSQALSFLAYFLERGQYRNYAMVTIGIYTALRIGDILKLRWNDVYDFDTKRMKNFIFLTEQKTGKRKQIALHKNVIDALTLYFSNASPNTPIIKNEQTSLAISRIQAYRIIDGAAKSVGIPHKVSCHSLRKTFGYHSRHNGTSLALLTEIFNHNSYTTTKRYLGITQDEKNNAYLNFNIWQN